jgi:hypothetical protein
MPERQLFYESLHAPAAEPEAQWLFRRQSAVFKTLNAIESNALYLELNSRVHAFSCLEGAARAGKALSLPLHYGPLCMRLQGEVHAEYVSAERGERRSHLEALFPLPGGWELHLKHIARQELVSGRVRLTTELWFKPGHALSFRWILVARALRWALAKSIASFDGGNHVVPEI